MNHHCAGPLKLCQKTVSCLCICSIWFEVSFAFGKMWNQNATKITLSILECDVMGAPLHNQLQLTFLLTRLSILRKQLEFIIMMKKEFQGR